jgi:hypothetical protein
VTTKVVAPAPAPQTEGADTKTILLGAGATTFVVTYGVSVIVAATSDNGGDKYLYYPIAGPWIDLANRDACNSAASGWCNEGTYKTLLVIDGILQAAGVAGVVAGLIMPTPEHGSTVARGVHFAPTTYGHGMPGVMAFGSF